MKLYGYWRSSSAYRVRIALGLKGIAVEHVPVHLVRGGGEQHGAAYLEKNPMAEVPALELDTGELLTQSVAILEYLEETHPTPALLPSAPLARAHTRTLVQIVNSGIQPLQNRVVLLALERHGIDTNEWVRRFMLRGLGALEVHASKAQSAFSVGDTPTLADVYLVPQLMNARRWSLPLEQFPNLTRIEARCFELEAFDRARPERQPDAEAV